MCLSVRQTQGASLRQILAYEGNVEEAFGLTFQVSRDSFGVVQTVDLKPGGGDIPVTNANRDGVFYSLFLLFSVASVVGVCLAFGVFQWERCDCVLAVC